MNERHRIRAAFARRAALGLGSRYDRWEPANLYRLHERERALLNLLRRHEMLPLGDRRVLDVGCGSGSTLIDFLLYGAKPRALAGVDLLEDRVAAARELNPHLDLRVGDASNLPFGDESFDIALAFTLFSSIKEWAMRQRVAKEMLRVLVPGGGVVWYDFWINPVNRDVQPLPLKEIRDLFPGCRLDARRVTLAPPLARALAPYSRFACELVAKLPILRTHWLVWISRR
jgi:ubiquinone/menaquinone biosynthesis C-methylase UbiE